MDYGSLLRSAWHMTWQHRFFWLLAFFAGGTGSTCSFGGDVGQITRLGNGGGSGDARSADQVLGGLAAQLNAWLAQNIGVVLAVIGLSALTLILLVAISLICQGALARATTEIALGQPCRLGRAWREGCRLVWRYLGLALLLFGLFLGAVLMVATAIALAFIANSASGGVLGPLLLVAGILVGVVLVLIAIPLGIGLSIVVVFAQRIMAVAEVGPASALARGYRLLRANLGSALLVWLLSLGLGIGAGLVVLFAFLGLAIPLGLIGLLLYLATGGFSTGLWLYAAIAVLLLVVALALLGAIANSYVWSFWSLAYLRLAGRLSRTFLPEPTN